MSVGDGLHRVLANRELAARPIGRGPWWSTVKQVHGVRCRRRASDARGPAGVTARRTGSGRRTPDADAGRLVGADCVLAPRWRGADGSESHTPAGVGSSPAWSRTSSERTEADRVFARARRSVRAASRSGPRSSSAFAKRFAGGRDRRATRRPVGGRRGGCAIGRSVGRCEARGCARPVTRSCSSRTDATRVDRPPGAASPVWVHRAGSR